MAAQDDLLSVGIKLTASGTNSYYGNIREFKIVGVIMDESFGLGNLFVSDSVFTQMWDEQKVKVDYYTEQTTNYKKESDDIYNSVYVTYDGTKEQTDAYWKQHGHTKYDENDSRIKPSNNSIQTLIEIDSLMDLLSKIVLYGGLGFVLFASLLFSVSISQKQKDIGILRALGARGSDLFKIFFSESLCIAVICVVLSMIASMIGCSYLNAISIERFDVALFIFGIPSVISLSLIAIATTFIATFLPVQNAAKKKPVESIRAL